MNEPASLGIAHFLSQSDAVADQSVAYRAVAETLADASKAGLSKVGFFSEADRP